MKTKLTIVLIFFMAINVFAYTEIDNPVHSGVWPAETYYITENVTLNVDSTLEISAGAIVKFAPNTQMSIHGELTISGSSGAQVIFTSANDNSVGEIIAGSTGDPQPGDYYYIGMNGYAGQGICNAEWGIFRYGGEQYGNMNFIQNAGGSVTNCLFEHSADNGLRIYQSEIFIDGCEFSNNNSNGLSAWYYSTPHITNNTFTNNGNYAIYLSTVHATTPFTGNTASDNNIDGIVIRGNDAFDVNNSNILYNSGQMPYVIEGNTPIYDTLTIEAGTIVKFMEGAYIYTGNAGGGQYGTIIVNGTEAEPVYFTSLHNDSIGGDTNNNDDTTLPQPGDWEYISILNGRGEFNWCNISFGGNTQKMLYFWNGGSGFFRNGEIKYSATTGVYTNSNHVELENNIIEGNGTAGIYLTGNNAVTHISNNQILGNGDNGITCYSAAPHLINNQISDNLGNAGYFQSTLFKYPFEGNEGSGNQINGFVVASVSTDSSSTLNNNSASLPFVFRNNVVTYHTLTFEEGTIIKFEATSSYVYTSTSENSKVIVNGAENNPVIFTSLKDDAHAGDTNGDGNATTPQASDWKNISISSSSEGQFNYCRVLYAGASSSSAIYFNGNAAGFVKNSQIKNSGYYGLGVNHTVISVEDCHIQNNNGGVYLYQDGSGEESGSIFNRNIISDNEGFGVNISYHSKPVFRNNRIENNSGYGINIQTSTPNLGGVENETAADGGKNVFTGNDNNGYQIYYNGTDSIRALNNYWQWNNADSIDQHIYDDNENASSGEVLFSPWMEELEADFNVNSTSGNSPLTVQFSDQSIGSNIISWKWDFENDGVYDSYEQNPEFTYTTNDTFDVKLVISDGAHQDSIIKTDFIQVTSQTAIGAENGFVPSRMQLNQNYPNPFNPTTTIGFSVNKNSQINISIYNIAGQLVKTIIKQRYQPGNYSVIWEGRDLNGMVVPSGIYIFSMKADNFSSQKRMLFLK